VEAVTHSGRRYLRLFDLVFERAEQDVVQSVHDFFHLSVDALEKSEWADGCPIATVALEAASTSEPLRHACAEVFVSWEASIAGRLAPGVGEERAKELATYVLAAFEGAIVLSRTAHDTRALRVTAGVVAATLRSELG
jgi:hypothetical protein